MNREEYFTSELTKHKQAFEAGHYAALLDAFALCVISVISPCRVGCGGPSLIRSKAITPSAERAMVRGAGPEAD